MLMRAGALAGAVLALVSGAWGSVEWEPLHSQVRKDLVFAVRFGLAHGFADPRGGELCEAVVRDEGADPLWSTSFSAVGWKMPGTQKLVSYDGLTYDVVKTIRPVSIYAFLGRRKATGSSDIWADRHASGLVISFLIKGQDVAAAMVDQQVGSHFVARSGISRLTEVHLFAHQDRIFRALCDRDYVRASRLIETFLSNAAVWRDACESQPLYVSEVNLEPGRQANGSAIEEYHRIEVVPIFRPERWTALLSDCQRRLSTPLSLEIGEKLSPERQLRNQIDALGNWQWFRRIRESSETAFRNLGDQIQVQGDIAVEPLLDAIESDKRLTIGVLRQGFRGQNPLPTVGDEAYFRLGQILPMYLSTVPREKFDLAKFRVAWKRIRDLSYSQRCVEVLQDDEEGVVRWNQALRGLLWLPKHEKRKLSYLNEFVAKRVKLHLESTGPPGLRDHFVFDLLKLYSDWDPKGADPFLRAAVSKFLDSPDLGFKSKDATLIAVYALAVRKNSGTDDDPLFRRYCDWLRTLKFDRFSGQQHHVLYPLLYDPSSEAFQSVFTPQSDWSRKAILSFWWRAELLASRFILAPAFRDRVKELLRDKRTLGKVTFSQNTVVAVEEVRLDGGDETFSSSWPRQYEVDSRFVQPDGTTFTYRLCDNIALCLISLKGCPDFSLAWPVEMRDKAIGRIVEFLKKNEKRLGSLLIRDEFWDEAFGRPPLW